MEAIILPKFGGPDVFEYRVVPKPTPVIGQVLIRVKAFGLNHAEVHMRRGEWDEWNPIMGLECAGIVEACPSGEFPVGSTVVGVMGGIGRSLPGSYGEYLNVPISNVMKIDTTLSWEELAALPEVYSTAYSCTFTILDVQPGETLLVRGATSTIGQAVVNLAVNAGAQVTGTTRRPDRFDMLRKMGVQDVKIEQQELHHEFPAGFKFDKVLNLIGNRVLLESISLTRTGGRMLQAGWLGGLRPVENFNPQLEMEPGVYFSLFHSGKVLGAPEFPLSAIPFQEIVHKIENGMWNAKPTYVFEYKDIQKAHEMLDSSNAGGKIVVKH